jgi:hypothetical protein
VRIRKLTTAGGGKVGTEVRQNSTSKELSGSRLLSRLRSILGRGGSSEVRKQSAGNRVKAAVEEDNETTK